MTKTLSWVKCFCLLLVRVDHNDFTPNNNKKLFDRIIDLLENCVLFLCFENLSIFDKLVDLLPGDVFEKWIVFQWYHDSAPGFLGFRNFMMCYCRFFGIESNSVSAPCFKSIDGCGFGQKRQISLGIDNSFVYVDAWLVFKVLLIGWVFVERVDFLEFLGGPEFDKLQLSTK